MISVIQYRSIMPLSAPRLADFLIPLNSAMLEFGINTPLRQAAFIATIAHESAELSRMVENLNYSAKGLASTWPTRFKDPKTNLPNIMAMRLERKPEAIANYVYGGRGGNGPEQSGDGWKYRGRGPIGVTFLDNYRSCSVDLYGDDTLVRYPELLEKPRDGCRSAARFFKVNGILPFADRGDFDGVCDKVNKGRKTDAVGDAIGWADRLAYYKRAKVALGVA